MCTKPCTQSTVTEQAVAGPIVTPHIAKQGYQTEIATPLATIPHPPRLLSIGPP
jgi:hypothetical protein